VIIALDGPAASGKGTLGRALAKRYGLVHLDTGALYRAVARDALNSGVDPADAEAVAALARDLDRTTLDDTDLRSAEVGAAASIVSAHPQVRQALLDYQRAVAAHPDGAILDGRDIGTVVCPDADVKLFVTASAEERARRRYAELREAGSDISLEEVQAEVRVRDERDSARAVSPLRPADDAHLLDTTDLGIEAAFKAAVELIDAATGQTGCAS
jgi:cytidylate kinase